MLKVLFCALKNEYGKPELGPATIENKHFFGTLKRMEGVEAEYFPFDEIMQRVGRDEMNRRLIARVEEVKPDLLFCFLFTEELKKETIAYITNKTRTKTLNWFADDNARFPIFSKYWAPLFTAVATTDSQAPARYRALGVKQVIKTQWAANQWIFEPQDPGKHFTDYDITFVGKNYGRRQWYVQFLQQHQLPAKGFGKGWPSGVVDNQKMLEIFSFSKINLNFTESPYVTWKDRTKALAKLFVKKELGTYKPNIHKFFPSLQSLKEGQRRQIKTRTFEVPACGGFLLTGKPDDDVSEYYIPGKEIELFSTPAELAEKCQYYLTHEQQRKAIAQAGYERTVRQHTYVHRFRDIFKAMGLE